MTAEALNTKGVALARLGRSREAVREVERSIEVAEAAGLPGAACRGYTNLGVLYTTIDPARAIEVCRRGLEVSRAASAIWASRRVFSPIWRSPAAPSPTAAPPKGVPAAEKAIEIDRALDQREHLPVPLIVLGQIHQCHGQPATRRPLLRRGAGRGAAKQVSRSCFFRAMMVLATLNLDLDNLAEAERYFSLAQGVCAQHGLDPEALVVLPFLD